MKIDGREVDITHPDKPMYPDDGITKQDVADYYVKVAPKMLPIIKDRPVVMQRYPDGINGEAFYQKEAGEYFPDWIKTVTVDLIKGGRQHLVTVDSAATLAYLANQAALTLHIWLCTRRAIHKPDRMVFDLDPSEDDFGKVKRTAWIMKDVLENHGYGPELMTTGSRGLHVVVPISPRRDFETVHKMTRELAEEARAQDPELMTTEARIAKRGKKVYLDVARNSYGQTQVAPYSLRAKPGAPVATPIGWEELDKLRSSQEYNLRNIGRRLNGGQ